MTDIIAGLSNETLVLLGSYVFFTGVIIYFYRFSNKKIMKRIKELKRKDSEMYKLIEKINNIRVREHKESNRRINHLEKQMKLILKPEGHEKELERERLYIER